MLRPNTRAAANDYFDKQLHQNLKKYLWLLRFPLQKSGTQLDVAPLELKDEIPSCKVVVSFFIGSPADPAV
ncbi:hypothetical protein FHS45_003267 [Thalassobacillus devorans]|nr:hypothetical protein [Thalassobacillus devorans]